MERDANGNTCRGTSWVEFTVAELKAFIACTMLIGLKRQPNRKTYWNKRGLFYHCLVVQDRNAPGYDKMGQLRWLLDHLRGAFKREWTLGKFITVDEMMIGYKGSYCPARQYLPQKHKNGG